MLHTWSVRTRYIFQFVPVVSVLEMTGKKHVCYRIQYGCGAIVFSKYRHAIRVLYSVHFIIWNTSCQAPGTPGIYKAASGTYPSTPSLRTLVLSSLRFTYQKEYLHESTNRWAAAISRLSGLNPSSWVQRRRPVCLSARSCCNTTATCSNVTGLPSSSHTSHRPVPPSQSFSHASPPSDQASWLQSCDLWIICGYLSSCCRADKYPYHIARRRMFEHTGGEGFRVSVHVERQECPSPPSRLQRRDRRQDVVSRAYSCRLIITDFHFCNCTLITLRVC